MAGTLTTQCCIAGGGPAGAMLGLLLARQGLDVAVLEKHADFLRDFRGDTVHASTLELMHELGVLDEFLRLPHPRMDHLDFDLLGERVPGPDFRRLPTHCKFIALMPQWDFLEFVRRQASREAGFRLHHLPPLRRTMARMLAVGQLEHLTAGPPREPAGAPTTASRPHHAQ